MAKERVGTIETIACNHCGLSKHTIRGSFYSHWEDNEGDVSGGATHDLLECNGCSHGTYRVSAWFSEEPGDPSITYWPPRKGDSQSREPREFANLEWGSAVESAYRQTMAAFNHGLSTLAAAGVRLLIEGLCLDQGILTGKNYTEQGKVVRDKAGKIATRANLEGKINGLLAKGLISKTQAKVLHQIRKLGNDAAHALDQPSLKVVGDSLNVVEHLFEQIYEHPDLLNRLMNRSKPAKPVRAKKAKKK